jgi:hypothetical protein
MECESGRQISGRVVLSQKDGDHQTVVVDTGREFTRIRTSDLEVDIKPGQRIRAKAEVVNDKNIQTRMMMWRFADLEREQARKKGKGKDVF